MGTCIGLVAGLFIGMLFSAICSSEGDSLFTVRLVFFVILAGCTIVGAAFDYTLWRAHRLWETNPRLAMQKCYRSFCGREPSKEELDEFEDGFSGYGFEDDGGGDD